MRFVLMPDVLLNIPSVILHAHLRAQFILNLVSCLTFGWSVGAVVVDSECEFACDFECILGIAWKLVCVVLLRVTPRCFALHCVAPFELLYIPDVKSRMI